MSDTYLEPVSEAKPLASVPSRLPAWSRWPKRILLLLIFLWVGTEAISLAIQHTRLQRTLTAQLEAAFGRSVQVGSYHLSLWGGPVLDAQSVTVGEDPRFGGEYFLRADSLAIRLRWRSLLHGRIQFGTLSLTRPSLNLVRGEDGDWNLAEWLPRPTGAPAPHAYPGPVLPASSAPRFSRIEVDGGRINFKLADEKIPFAFIGVTGTVETDRPGRWRMDLQATPWRAAVILQQAGTIHLSGEVGGTSSRLRPAALDVSWTDASVSDVLRLARGNDFGVRGALALSVSARTQESGGWTVQGRAELRQIHRWDLALRPDNPSVNLAAQLAWNPAGAYVELTRVTLETPHSNARASGRIAWNEATTRRALRSPPLEGIVASSTVDMSDLLTWVRAFRPGVADGLGLRGLAVVRANFSGWPPQLANAAVSSEGVDASGGGLRKPAHLGPVDLHYSRGTISFLPVALSWGAAGGEPDGSFRLDASGVVARKTSPGWHVTGSTSQVRDLTVMSSALGFNISRGWDLSGSMRCDLRWAAAQFPWQAQPVGFVEWGTDSGGATLRLPFLNQPVEQIRARADLKPGVRHVALSSAQAFGARWTGSFERRDPAAPWQFTLSADRLSTADFDRWLNPRWRQSFLGRMLPFLNSRPLAAATPEGVRASGRLTVNRFAFAPLAVSSLQGDLEVDGRHLTLANATGQFYGGQVSGSLDANLQATPSYHADLDFSHLDVSALTAATPSLAHLFAGAASGQISLTARGALRADLLASLECKGKTRVLGPELRGVNLGLSLRDGTYRPGSDRFTGVDAAFTCANQTIELQSLDFVRVDTGIEGSGTIDFSRNLDLRLQEYSAIPDRQANTFRLTGSPAAFQITQISTPPRRALVAPGLR